MLAFVRAAGPSSPEAFDPGRLRLDEAPGSPLPRRVLGVLLGLLAMIGGALAAGRLDVVVVAEGRLVPRTLVKIVQPAEAGVLRELLVDEGDDVLPGQPLIRLDARLAEADLRAQRAELVQRLLALRRVDAELSGAPLRRHDGDIDEAFQRAEAQLKANRAAYRDALEQAEAQVTRLAREVAASREVEAKLARTVPIVQTMAQRYDRLQREGFVSELFALERERERIEREQDLKSQRHAVEALEAGLAHARRQLAQVSSTARRELHAERAQHEAQAARLREEVDKQLVRREQVELAAPQAGTIKEIATRTPGAVVGAGTVLLTLVPVGEPIEADVWLRNEDAAHVRPGLRAQLKIAAYPFQKYGLLDATVLRVGPDATDAAGPPHAPEAAAHAGAYRARLALVAASLDHGGIRLPLQSGMAVVAEVHLGRRPVLDYLLAPVRKAWHESARER